MKRILLLLVVLCMVLTACAKAPVEEGAVADTVVEGETQNTPSEEDKPEIVPENPTVDTEEPDTPAETPKEEEPDAPTEDPTPDTPTEEPDPELPTEKNYNIKTMSFNVRYTDDPYGHSIAERAPRVKATIESHDPDLIGMQEVVPAWDELLRETMTEYEVLTHYRSATNLEGVSILYKKDTFTFLDEGFFWCSETPNVESHGWGSQFPRVCGWALLKQKSTGKEILFFSFHGEFNDEFSKGSCNLILKEIKKHPNAVPFLVGDFNLSTEAPGFAYFAANFDETRTIVSSPSSNPRMGTRPANYPDPELPDETLPSRDYLFHNEAMAEAVDYIVDTTRYDGYYASDHYALVGLYNIL